MFNLSTLPKIVTPSKKRYGRGSSSGKGDKSGRGTTRHQKARTSIKLLFEGGQNKLTKKFPLLRGKGRNKSRNVKPELITLSALDKLSENKDITLEFLIEQKVVTDKARKNGIKIMGGGDISRPINVKIPLTKSARIKIEKAGGTVSL
ncbi:MAG TPA: 50S ribosomal protein L15 [Candidatus Nitrosocosmicus sp.]|nr:50S ribosomal protein L15 [Candidatus Nitrosocosmicus sp.]